MQTLQHLRKSFGLTEQQLAQNLRVSKETIYSLEHGLTLPDVRLLIKIASLFEVTTDYLLDLHNDDLIELIDIYNTLNDVSKGRLLENAMILAEESDRVIKKRWDCLTEIQNVIYVDFNNNIY